MKYDFAPVRRTFAVALALVLVTLSADASKPRLRLERIDASDFESDAIVRVYASVVELEGTVDDDRAPPSFVLRMNGHNLGRPVKAMQFQGAGEPLDLVLVVESSALYGPKKIVIPPPPPPPQKGAKGQKGARPQKGKASPPAANKGKKLSHEVMKQMVAPGAQPLDKVKEAMHDLLEAMNPRFRVLLVDYGADYTPHPPFRPAQSVESDVDDLSPDGEAGDLVLTSAIRHALEELNKPRPDSKPARRLIVVISDGLNSQMDRATFKALGDLAAKSRVPIHTIAFSPTDERGPLLNLGEISKRSNGTFRWARTAEDLHAQLETLGDELNKQYVLTYKIDARSLEGKKFQLSCEDLESNVLVYDSSGGSFGLAPATRALIPLWLWLAIAALALGGAGVVLARRARRPKRAMKFSPFKAGAPATGGAPQPQPQPQPPAPRPQPQAPIQPVGRPAAQPAAPRAPTRGLLIVVSGALAGQRVEIGAQPVSIGKGPATLQISDDPTVSTRHAELALSGGAFVLTDLGSTNGTFVNNGRISQPTRLGDGDLLRFGNTQMKFRAE